MEKARPIAATLNANKQALSSLVTQYEEAAKKEALWRAELTKANEHRENLVKGLHAAQDWAIGLLGECRDAHIQRANIIIEYFKDNRAESTLQGQMDQHCQALHAAIENVMNVEVGESDCNPLAEECAKAEVTMRKTNAAGKAARKPCVQAATPKTKIEAMDTKGEKSEDA